MSLLAMELSDAGIIVVSDQGLIKVEQTATESPGFACGERKKLLLGKEAENRARLFPRLINNTFWDQLDTTSLKNSLPMVHNNAEAACAHLAHLRENINKYGTELVIAVPSFYTKEQLGLIIGITKELSLDVKGLVSLPVAASSTSCPDRLLLHLDIHLHRFEIIYLKQNDQLTEQDLITTSGKGLDFLYSEWMKAIADEFVRTTRFDPFHTAHSEQALYNHIPHILAKLRSNPALMFEMRGGSKTYHVSLSRDIFIRKSETVVRHLHQLIEEMRNRYGRAMPLTLQLTHRIAALPGITETLSRMFTTEVIELEPGAGAFGALSLCKQLSALKARKGVSFLTSRLWSPAHKPEKKYVPGPSALPHKQIRPTHLLYRSLAYPITQRPLLIGKGDASEGINVQVHGQLAGVSRKHCTVELRNNDVILTDLSTYGTYVDDSKVSDTTIVLTGQVIRVGTPGEKLSPIVCINRDET
jgi:hypothetical protein